MHLGEEQARREVVRRIQALRPDATALWGKMTVGQMVCHLFDSFRVGLGEKSVSPATSPLERTLVKWVALSVPLRWPHNVPTRPEAAQGLGGTPPTEFERDRGTLLQTVAQFSEGSRLEGRAHPIFGPLTAKEWLRWGYLHADHHLRQFGV